MGKEKHADRARFQRASPSFRRRGPPSTRDEGVQARLTMKRRRVRRGADVAVTPRDGEPARLGGHPRASKP